MLSGPKAVTEESAKVEESLACVRPAWEAVWGQQWHVMEYVLHRGGERVNVGLGGAMNPPGCTWRVGHARLKMSPRWGGAGRGYEERKSGAEALGDADCYKEPRKGQGKGLKKG